MKRQVSECQGGEGGLPTCPLAVHLIYDTVVEFLEMVLQPNGLC